MNRTLIAMHGIVAQLSNPFVLSPLQLFHFKWQMGDSLVTFACNGMFHVHSLSLLMMNVSSTSNEIYEEVDTNLTISDESELDENQPTLF